MTQSYSKPEVVCLKHAEKENCFQIILKHTTYTNIYYNIYIYVQILFIRKWKQIATKWKASLFRNNNKKLIIIIIKKQKGGEKN